MYPIMEEKKWKVKFRKFKAYISGVVCAYAFNTSHNRCAFEIIISLGGDRGRRVSPPLLLGKCGRATVHGLYNLSDTWQYLAAQPITEYITGKIYTLNRRVTQTRRNIDDWTGDFWRVQFNLRKVCNNLLGWYILIEDVVVNYF